MAGFKSGNKGEWSELYVLLRMLAYGKLYIADSDMKKIEDAYFTVLEVLRQEGSAFVRYDIRPGKPVDLYFNGDKIRSISRTELTEYADFLLAKLQEKKGLSFEIEGIDEVMKNIGCEKIKADADDKSDIQLKIKENMYGLQRVVGFSIKSDIGTPPTLLNASKATNFRYELENMTDETMELINATDTKNKLVDRIKMAAESGKIIPRGAINKVFSGNLRMIDAVMDDILQEILLIYYRDGVAHLSDIVTKIEELDPIGFDRPGIYRYKVKRLLSAVALGMMPSKIWSGQDEANGGYIIVKEDGEVLAYHLYNRDFFETYLLNNTRLEKGSSTRHEYGSVYEEAGKKYMNLNLQIRFI